MGSDLKILMHFDIGRITIILDIEVIFGEDSDTDSSFLDRADVCNINCRRESIEMDQSYGCSTLQTKFADDTQEVVNELLKPPYVLWPRQEMPNLKRNQQMVRGKGMDGQPINVLLDMH